MPCSSAISGGAPDRRLAARGQGRGRPGEALHRCAGGVHAEGDRRIIRFAFGVVCGVPPARGMTWPARTGTRSTPPCAQADVEGQGASSTW